MAGQADVRAIQEEAVQEVGKAGRPVESPFQTSQRRPHHISDNQRQFFGRRPVTAIDVRRRPRLPQRSEAEPEVDTRGEAKGAPPVGTRVPPQPDENTIAQEVMELVLHTNFLYVFLYLCLFEWHSNDPLLLASAMVFLFVFPFALNQKLYMLSIRIRVSSVAKDLYAFSFTEYIFDRPISPNVRTYFP